ncbi:MAG: hypothetical protein B7Y90_16615 [Alphaproteobacteria bacterium 32-64-14]|nr:MAG: hypothetical protein B7Y90_16615 [Alphaproteobacteria bacterium 32-64-14]
MADRMSFAAAASLPWGRALLAASMVILAISGALAITLEILAQGLGRFEVVPEQLLIMALAGASGALLWSFALGAPALALAWCLGSSRWWHAALIGAGAMMVPMVMYAGTTGPKNWLPLLGVVPFFVFMGGAAGLAAYFVLRRKRSAE